MTKRRLGRQKRGKVIRATFLNDIAEDVDDLNDEYLRRPTDNENPLPPAVQDADADAPTASNYVESSRSTSTVQVFDQNDENYAEVQRIEQITFINSEGDVLTLTFIN